MTAVHAFEDLLTPDALSALMRSTWTWDDRALRRDLAALLVDVDAARFAASTDGIADHAETLRSRAFATGAEFVTAVLGPRYLVRDAIDAAGYERTASSAFARVRECAEQYASRQAAAIQYPPESSWLTLVSRDLGSAMRAYGKVLSASNFFGNAGLAWQALRASADDSGRASDYAKAIESETISATLAAAEEAGSWDPAIVRTKAVRGQDCWLLSGSKRFVPAADGADVYFVIARSIAGPSLFAVERSAPGLTVTPLAVNDETRPLHEIELADTPAALVGVEGAGGRLMTATIDLATTALASEQVGLIDNAMNMLAEAGTPDDSLAEVTLQHVAAVSLWRNALAEQANRSVDFSAAAAAAHIGCSGSSVRATTTVAQVLGPSTETDALLRRARSASLLFGGPALYHERLLERLGV